METTSSLLSKTLLFAEPYYGGQFWKKTARPMLYHPLAVSSLVLKYGGTTAQAQAALLHDLIDLPELSPALLTEKFGAEVARLTYAFSDPALPEGVASTWVNHKKVYLEKVRSLDSSCLLVVLCEELHELSELVEDLKTTGSSTWERYPVPDRDITWYFRGLAEIAYKNLSSQPYQALVQEFARKTRELVGHVHEGSAL